MIVILKGERAFVSHSMNMAGMNLSLLDASGIHAMVYSVFFVLFFFHL